MQVDSKPKSSNYRWFFNSSETRFEIPSAESVMSFGNYKPTSGDEHGQVLCWATNDLGEQKEPCVFNVVPLGSPSPPTDCQVRDWREGERERERALHISLENACMGLFAPSSDRYLDDDDESIKPIK